MRGRGQHTARTNAFTLIEMIAVVLILALATSLVVPNLSATRSSRLRDQGRKIAHALEIARQRAIATGRFHRLYVDLEEGWWQVEWYVDEATAYPELEEYEPEPIASLPGGQVLGPGDYDLSAPIPMSPPVGDERDYYPVSGAAGKATMLGDDFYFVGVDSESGWHESGAIFIGFGPDGVAEYTELRLADAWDNVVVLEVAPLLELIHVREADDV